MCMWVLGEGNLQKFRWNPRSLEYLTCYKVYQMDKLYSLNLHKVIWQSCLNISIRSLRERALLQIAMQRIADATAWKLRLLSTETQLSSTETIPLVLSLYWALLHTCFHGPHAQTFSQECSQTTHSCLFFHITSSLSLSLSAYSSFLKLSFNFKAQLRDLRHNPFNWHFLLETKLGKIKLYSFYFLFLTNCGRGEILLELLSQKYDLSTTLDIHIFSLWPTLLFSN